MLLDSIILYLYQNKESYIIRVMLNSVFKGLIKYIKGNQW
jgi:hypothetical protein